MNLFYYEVKQGEDWFQKQLRYTVVNFLQYGVNLKKGEASFRFCSLDSFRRTLFE